ncbi:hypothetical protein D3C72_1462630 [compost metagenome]
MPPQFAFLYGDVAFRHFELLGEKLDQMSVGLAVYRRGGNGDFKFVAMQTDNLVAAGFRLNI